MISNSTQLQVDSGIQNMLKLIIGLKNSQVTILKKQIRSSRRSNQSEVGFLQNCKIHLRNWHKLTNNTTNRCIFSKLQSVIHALIHPVVVDFSFKNYFVAMLRK